MFNRESSHTEFLRSLDASVDISIPKKKEMSSKKAFEPKGATKNALTHYIGELHTELNRNGHDIQAKDLEKHNSLLSYWNAINFVDGSQAIFVKRAIQVMITVLDGHSADQSTSFVLLTELHATFDFAGEYSAELQRRIQIFNVDASMSVRAAASFDESSDDDSTSSAHAALLAAEEDTMRPVPFSSSPVSETWRDTPSPANSSDNGTKYSPLSPSNGLSNQMNNTQRGYIRRAVAGDGDCGFTAFGITRDEAVRQLQSHNDRIRDIISLPVQQDLLNENFYNYLVGIGRVTCMHEVLINNLGQNATDLNVQFSYIQYAISDKAVDSGWAHPKILQALAQIRDIELHMWVLGADDVLVPHRVGDEDYSVYRPLNAANPGRVDLLFVNGNHFERLEFEGYPAGIPEEGIYPHPDYLIVPSQNSAAKEGKQLTDETTASSHSGDQNNGAYKPDYYTPQKSSTAAAGADTPTTNGSITDAALSGAGTPTTGGSSIIDAALPAAASDFLSAMQDHFGASSARAEFTPDAKQKIQELCKVIKRSAPNENVTTVAGIVARFYIVLRTMLFAKNRQRRDEAKHILAALHQMPAFSAVYESLVNKSELQQFTQVIPPKQLSEQQLSPFKKQLSNKHTLTRETVKTVCLWPFPWSNLYAEGVFGGRLEVIEKRTRLEVNAAKELEKILAKPVKIKLSIEEQWFLTRAVVDYVDTENDPKKMNAISPFHHAIQLLAIQRNEAKDQLFNLLCVRIAANYVDVEELPFQQSILREHIKKLKAHAVFSAPSAALQEALNISSENRLTELLATTKFTEETAIDFFRNVDEFCHRGPNEAQKNSMVEKFKQAFDKMHDLFLDPTRENHKLQTGFFGKRENAEIPKGFNNMTEALTPKPGVPPYAFALYCYYRCELGKKKDPAHKYKRNDAKPYEEKFIQRHLVGLEEYKQELNAITVDGRLLGDSVAPNVRTTDISYPLDFIYPSLNKAITAFEADTKAIDVSALQRYRNIFLNNKGYFFDMISPCVERKSITQRIADLNPQSNIPSPFNNSTK